MKLRIKGNSIRLRLTQGEVAALASEGKVVEAVEFGDESAPRFAYELRASAEIESVRAAFDGGKISVFVPQTQAETWAANNETGVYSAPGAKIKIAVEKDFACLAPRDGEDESDNFPHPKSGEVC